MMVTLILISLQQTKAWRSGTMIEVLGKTTIEQLYMLHHSTRRLTFRQLNLFFLRGRFAFQSIRVVLRVHPYSVLPYGAARRQRRRAQS